MNKMRENMISSLEIGIKQALKNFENNRTENSLSDLYIYFKEENFSLELYDDMENLLKTIDLNRFSKMMSSGSIRKQVVPSIKSALQSMLNKKQFNADYILKPFSVSLVEKDFSIKEELIFIDGDKCIVDGELLPGVNAELDRFLKDLLNC
ncbi:hypothetical protein AwDysgo_17450 [Bacteroidales bacterium]|nr:hypothetical protein AwDysgo_17450 [Bacteroidales bacterium]